jgi:hypothetical protein
MHRYYDGSECPQSELHPQIEWDRRDESQAAGWTALWRLVWEKATLTSMIAAIPQGAVVSACKLSCQTMREQKDTRTSGFVKTSNNSFSAAKMGH